MLRSRRLLMIVSLATLALCSLLAAGCGGGNSPAVAIGSTTASAAGPPAGANTQTATGLVVFASCMRSHGVPNFPDPSSSGGIPKQAVVSAFEAVSRSQAGAAQNACNHLLPAGGMSGQAVRALTPQDRQDYLRAAACMRSHGFPDFPDPKFQNNGAHVDIPSSIDQNSSQFTRAATMCTKLIPAGLPASHRASP